MTAVIGERAGQDLEACLQRQSLCRHVPCWTLPFVAGARSGSAFSGNGIGDETVS